MQLPIRVLCVFSTLDRGGAESMCMNLYRHMDREKVQFDFVKHTNEKCAFDDEIISLGGQIYIAPRFKGYNLKQYQDWWKMHLTLHPEYRIIHGHYFTVSKYYFSVCKKMGRITIGHSHTDTYSIKDPIKRIMIHGVENYCDYCLACSEKAGKLLYPHKNYTILKNAIDVEQYKYDVKTAQQVRNEFGWEDDFVLGTVGTIKEVKNPIGLIDILNAVASVKPEVKLLWVGRDGGMKGEAEKAIAKYGLIDKVIFTGNRSDVDRLMQGMDAFLLPSFSEGIPVTLIEAQASGLPCFVSNTVSQEADITGLIQFLPLSDRTMWRDKIVFMKTSRCDTRKKLYDSGYDIRTSAKWLQELYLSI